MNYVRREPRRPDAWPWRDEAWQCCASLTSVHGYARVNASSIENQGAERDSEQIKDSEQIRGGTKLFFAGPQKLILADGVRCCACAFACVNRVCVRVHVCARGASARARWRARVRAHVRACSRARVLTCARAHVRACARARVRAHVRARVCVHVCAHARVHLRVLFSYGSTYIYIY